MRYPILSVLFLAAILFQPLTDTLAGTDNIPPAGDLREEARQAAARGLPLVIVFSRRDCKYCDAVKRDYLKPLHHRKEGGQRPVVREIGQDSEAMLTGFKGEAMSHAVFAAGEKIKLVPVVAFYGPDGRQLAKPIVGALLPDFYQSYLDEGLERSAAALKGR